MTIPAYSPLSHILPRDENALPVPKDAPDLGQLPDWDLTDLYAAPDAPELARDLETLEKACNDFARDFEGRLISLSPAKMLECVERYQQIDVLVGRLMSYVGLRYYQNTTDAARAKQMGD
ncbi:MAG TPA: oligoendopeptidase F, partial [Paracoccus sp. (in: a-proteobacteria)]|nr:oligoendopeptidase F [Paracoccus sp. (in: a-proteobacteria)]